MTPLGDTYPRDMKKKRRKEFKQLCQSLGLQIYSVSPAYADANLTSVSPGMREETIKWVKDNIDLARDLEAKFVVIIPGKRYMFYTMPLDIAWKYSIHGLKECAKHAENLGITCLIEQAPFMFVEYAKEVKKLVEDINSPNVMGLIDTGNACVRESPQAAIEVLGNLLGHIHITDGDGKTFAHLPVGMGSIDFDSVRRSLDRIGFKGMSILEIWHPTDLEGGIIQSKENLKKLGWTTGREKSE